jgi:hypothetical protein
MFFRFAVLTNVISMVAFLVFAVPMSVLAARDPSWAQRYRLQSRRPRAQDLVGPSVRSFLVNNAWLVAADRRVVAVDPPVRHPRGAPAAGVGRRPPGALLHLPGRLPLLRGASPHAPRLALEERPLGAPPHPHPVGHHRSLHAPHRVPDHRVAHAGGPAAAGRARAAALDLGGHPAVGGGRRARGLRLPVQPHAPAARVPRRGASRLPPRQGEGQLRGVPGARGWVVRHLRARVPRGSGRARADGPGTHTDA